jgi:hypothetical protein
MKTKRIKSLYARTAFTSGLWLMGAAPLAAQSASRLTDHAMNDWTPQQVMKQEQENRQESKYTCAIYAMSRSTGKRRRCTACTPRDPRLATKRPMARSGSPRAGGSLCATKSTFNPVGRPARTTTPGATNTQTSSPRPAEVLPGLSSTLSHSAQNAAEPEGDIGLIPA